MIVAFTEIQVDSNSNSLLSKSISLNQSNLNHECKSADDERKHNNSTVEMKGISESIKEKHSHNNEFGESGRNLTNIA